MLNKKLTTAFAALFSTGLVLADVNPSLHDNPIFGTILSSEDWDMEANPQYGIYSFNGEVFEPIVTDYYLAALGGGTYVNGLYCYNYNFSFMGSMAQNLYLIYDFERDVIEGWELYETSYSDVATQVAYDATSDKVYGQFYSRDRSGLVWGTRDIEYGVTEAIREMEGENLAALAFDNLGRAWAVDAKGYLLQIDKLSGDYMTIGHTGLTLAATTQQSGAIDPVSGTFYMFAVTEDESSALYSVDLTSAHATKIADTPANEQITGAYFLPLTYAAAAPGAPSQMQLAFDRESMIGTVSCVAPSVKEDGSSLAEGATLTLTLDGVKVGEAQTTPGQNVSFDVTVPAAGTHVFQFIASNASGQGRPATVHQWIGLDVPVAVTNLACRNIDNTHAVLTWSAPTEGVHGGYIDPAHLNYTIVDSEGTAVSSGVTDTQCEVSKSGSRLTARTYTVIACTDGEPGLSAVSNRVYFGNRYKVPYSTYFDNQAEFDLWYVIDANEDGSTWTYETYNRYVRYNYDKYNAADDWLFSAPIHLSAEQYYDLSSNMAAEMTYYQERFEIFVCNAQHPDSIIAVIRPATETEKDGKEERAYYKYLDYFSVPVDGDYFLAYHCISDANQLRLELRNVELTLGSSFDAPAAVDNPVFRPGAMGASDASVEFDAPTKSIRGNELTSLTKAELYRGNNLCGTLDDIVPGQHYTIYDPSAPRGFQEYRLLVYNEYGKGLPVTGTVFVGPDKPGAPQNVNIALEGNNVKMTWDPIEGGANGGYVDFSKISYKVVRQNDIEIVYDGTGFSCVDNTLPNYGPQTNYYYGVFAYYGTTASDGVPTRDVILGTPYSMPFEETFAEDSGNNSLWLIGYDYSDPYSTIGTNWSIGLTPSYDNELGNLTCTAFYDWGGFHFISSGKIKVNSSATHPVLHFPYMCTNMDDKIDVVISTKGVPDQGDIVATFSPSSTSDWNMATVDLTTYKGENIIITWRCYLAGAGDIVLDDIRVFDDPENGIHTLVDDRNISVPVYDLQGRRTEPGKNPGFQIAPSGIKLILNKK